MYERNKYIVMFLLGISIITYIFINNKLLALFLSLIFFSTRSGKKYKKIALITLFCTVFNIFCGKLLFFCKILLFFDTFLWITYDLNKKDIIRLLGSFFSNKVLKKVIIYIFYFPFVFINNYKIINCYRKNERFILKIRKASNVSKSYLKLIIIEFDKRLFFNKSQSFDFKLYYKDIISVSVILVIFILSITL